MLTQRIYEPLRDEDGNVIKDANREACSFRYRGGCTLIIDPEDGRVEYAISKCLASSRRRDRHEAFLRSQVENSGQEAVTRFGLTADAARERLQMEPFAFVHTHGDSSEGLY
jgi:hypothetical protein